MTRTYGDRHWSAPTADRALVVARDDALRGRAGDLLDRVLGGEVLRTASPARARKMLMQPDPPAVLLVAFDREEALDLIVEARAINATATIICLDALADEDSAAEAFAAGADDVIRLPFPDRELDARLRRRRGEEGRGKADPILSRLPLTPVEGKIMKLLLDSRGEIVTRDQLAQAVDNSDWVYGDRKFDVHITKIRKKLFQAFGPRFTVRTIRSAGYFLRDSDADL